MSKKHQFKSINGAVRRIKELEKAIDYRNKLLDQWRYDLVQLAKLAADTPQFYNPLQVSEAKEIRDRILRSAYVATFSEKNGGGV